MKSKMDNSRKGNTGNNKSEKRDLRADHRPSRGGMERLKDVFWNITSAVVAFIIISIITALWFYCREWVPKDSRGDAGKDVHNQATLSVLDRYSPTGLMGDIGDLTVERWPGVDRFTYEVRGRGPHEWDYKYVDCELNQQPARFAGAVYLDPPNNFGDVPGSGYDLRGFRHIRWDARCLSGEIAVEFVAGGITWRWNPQGNCPKKEPCLVPCSFPRTNLGIRRLSADWQSFEYDLSSMREDDLRRVIGAFAWTIRDGDKVASDGLSENHDSTVTTYVIELRNVRFDRD